MKLKALTLAVASLAIPASAAATYEINSSWEEPSERENGLALPPSEISHYSFYFSESAGGAVHNLGEDVAAPANEHTFEFDGITTGCLYVSAVDTDGLESELSDPACFNIASRPGKPGRMRFRFRFNHNQ
jgi:hypothetical protein